MNSSAMSTPALPSVARAPEIAPRFVTVRFIVPASVGAIFADVVGEFSSWVPLGMDRSADGSFRLSLGLERQRRWNYQFLLDGERLINDWNADDYVAATDGSCMSVLIT